MSFFIILGLIFVAIGIWAVFNNRKKKLQWQHDLTAEGLIFDDEHKLIRQEAILLHLRNQEAILIARGINYLAENKPTSDLLITPYPQLRGLRLEINHALVRDFTRVAMLLSNATIVKLDLETQDGQVHKLMFNPNDLADKKVKAALVWWANFLHALAARNSA